MPYRQKRNQCLLGIVACGITVIWINWLDDPNAGVKNGNREFISQDLYQTFTRRIVHAPNRNDSVVEKQMINLPMSEQDKRKLRIREFCQKRKMVAQVWTFKLDRRFKFLYCPIPKAGWSSWKRLWFYIHGVIKDFEQDIGIRADKDAGITDLRGERTIRYYYNQVKPFRFVFVRNPWERLVSSYINKAVDYNYTRILHSPCKWEKMVPYSRDLTFVQFLTCIADQTTGSVDMHWTPQWRLCDFCGMEYDYIGHLETVAEDASAIIQQLGLNVTYPKIFSSQKHNTKEVMEQWYSSVPAELLKKLLGKFVYDFELHGYEKNPPGRTDIA